MDPCQLTPSRHHCFCFTSDVSVLHMNMTHMCIPCLVFSSEGMKNLSRAAQSWTNWSAISSWWRGLKRSAMRWQRSSTEGTTPLIGSRWGLWYEDWGVGITWYQWFSQKLHDQAVEKRSTLKVAMDTEQQQQDLTDYKLHNEQQQNAISKGKHHIFAAMITSLVFQSKLWNWTLPSTSTSCRSKVTILQNVHFSHPQSILSGANCCIL